jgi:cytochrome P450
MTATQIPAHVGPARVVDFDFWRPGPPGSDPFLAWTTALHGKPPIVWTARNGGHWLVTRGEDIPKILADHERFSSRRVFIGMEGAPRSVPLEHDPPEHAPLRKLLMPAFSPRSVKHWADEAQRLAVELIEGFRSAGRCEFMREFATQLPIIVFLKIVNLPLEHRPMLLDWVSTAIRASEAEARARAREGMNAYMVDLVNRRLREPGDDILSQAINADLGNGQRMSYDMALGTARTLLGGGLDTVASTMGWIALFLAENPGHRRTLADDPRRIPRAIDEMMRRFSIANIARVVRNDMEYEGAQLKANEQVLMGTCLHGLDPSCFTDPLRVDFDRRDSHRHSTLSHGIHRCMGAPLALQEIRIFIEEWLKRIPDFEVDPEVPPVKVTGIAHALSQLGLRW